MKNFDIESIDKRLKSSLSEKRYQHCLRVSNIAQIVAKYLSYDEKKAKVAGLLHDCAKELPN